PFQLTLPFLCASQERNRRYENTGRPSSEKTFTLQEKCALRIRLRKRAYTVAPRIAAASAGLTCPRRPAALAAASPPAISTNSVNLSRASRAGDGNSSARFFVQPSQSWAKVRYMRVRTASAPYRNKI